MNKSTVLTSDVAGDIDRLGFLVPDGNKSMSSALECRALAL